MDDEHLGHFLTEIRSYRRETGTLDEEHISFLRDNSKMIEDYYRRRYMKIFDLCPAPIRSYINTGVVVDDAKSLCGKRNVVPTIRQAFTLCDFDLGEWCKQNEIALTDDTLDLS